MATKKEELELDLDEIPMNKVEIKPTRTRTSKVVTVSSEDKKELINCLRNERIVIRHIPKQSGMVTNPKHILYGGMAENAVKIFVVPRLSSGLYVNVLTDSEKDYLEYVMGLEPNALSIYKRTNNFWDDSNDNGISQVRLTKQDNYLDLSDPEDYIRYKILLCNKDYIASSILELQDTPKATYQFVIISEGEESKVAHTKMSATMQSYKEFGKIENNADLLRVIIETIDNRPLSSSTPLETLQTKINDLIIADSKLFLKVVQDELLDTKVLIRKAIENGLITKRGNFYYIYDSGKSVPMCEDGQEPTLNIAAMYLNAPKNQALKFTIEAKIK